MKLSNIIASYRSKVNENAILCLDKEIEHLAFKLDDIKPNTLFFCLKSNYDDISIEVARAKELGAVAVVCEEITDNEIIQIKVPSVRKALALFSEKFYNNPADKIKVIGITGTNGKTTSTYILKSILEAGDYKVGLIGTNGYMIGNKLYPLNMTTPDPIELQQILAQMVANECQFVVMEVSAHALYYDKIEGMTFECGIFTNCTQDHLDFFKTFDEYALTKTKFFNPKYVKTAVINLDDKLGKKILNETQVKSLTYGISNGDIYASNIVKSLQGSAFTIHNNEGMINVYFSMPGEYNIQNVLGCVACARILGLSMDEIKMGIMKVDKVNGRFEIYKTPKHSFAIIDYAHTPDGVENVLKNIKELTENKVITVFGCGGNRDATKRPLMGKIAGALSDFCIITSDNPRFENPYDIISEVESGVKDVTKDYACLENRKNAIEYALENSKEGDCIVILGKGAENYQEIQGIKHYFNDKDVVLNWCKEKKRKIDNSFEK